MSKASSDIEEQEIYSYLSTICPKIIPKHRILFYQSLTGKIAFARQLKPKLYIDEDHEACKTLTPHLTHVFSMPYNQSIVEDLLQFLSKTNS